MNQIKNIINLLGIRQKDIANYLGVSSQSLNIILKSKTPRKHNEKIARFLGIDSIFLIKDELSESDKSEIYKQYHKIYIEKFKPEITEYKDDLVLKPFEYLEWMKEQIYEDFYMLKVELTMKGLNIPKMILKWVEVEIRNNNILIFKSKKQYKEFCIDVNQIERTIIRENKPNHKIYLIELNNGLYIYIDLVCKYSYTMEDIEDE